MTNNNNKNEEVFKVLADTLMGEGDGGGVKFLVVKHDHDCQAVFTGRDCTCSPEYELADEQRFTTMVHKSRKERREAERKAKKAITKARLSSSKKGGAK